MSNVEITPGIGQTIAADAVDDATLGNASVQFVKLMDGTLGSTNKATVGSDGALLVDIGTGNISLSGPVTVQGNASATPVPVSGNVGIVGNQSISISGGSVGLLGGTSTIGALTGNQTVVVTSGNVGVTGNVGVVGNVSATIAGNIGLAAGTNVIGHVINDASSAVIGHVITDAGSTTTVSGNVAVNLTTVGNTTLLTGGVAGSQGVGGLAANNATASGNPIQASALAISAEATPATAGQNASLAVGLEHKLINLPYANKENMVRGTATIGNTTATTIIAAQGSGNKTYITGLQLGNTGNTTITVTVNDSATSVFIVPNGGGSNIAFHTPLVTAGNTAFTATASGNTTSLIVSAQGYSGS